MRRSLVFLGFGLFVVATSAVLAWRYPSIQETQVAQVTEPARETPPVEPPPRGYVGVVLAGDTVAIESYLSGRIEQIFVKPGDVVARGDRVAQLDSRMLRQSLAEAAASRAAAAARLKRRKVLARDLIPAVTPEELDDARFDAARHGAKVAGVVQDLSETTIVAPCDGTVSEQYLYAGAIAGPGRPIVRIVSAGEPKVRFAVPPEGSGEVTPDAAVEVALPSIAGRIRANVLSVSPQVDVYSGMVYAVASLPRQTSAEMNQRLATGGVLVRVFPSQTTRISE
jgi:RND family efflux transporter MFP subunit